MQIVSLHEMSKLISWKNKKKFKLLTAENFTEACRAQLFKTNNVFSLSIVKTLINKYGIYTKIFAEKM